MFKRYIFGSTSLITIPEYGARSLFESRNPSSKPEDAIFPQLASHTGPKHFGVPMRPKLKLYFSSKIINFLILPNDIIDFPHAEAESEGPAHASKANAAVADIISSQKGS